MGVRRSTVVVVLMIEQDKGVYAAPDLLNAYLVGDAFLGSGGDTTIICRALNRLITAFGVASIGKETSVSTGA